MTVGDPSAGMRTTIPGRHASPRRAAAAVLALSVVASGCLPPEVPPRVPADAPVPVRVHVHGSPRATHGLLVSLDADSVRWRGETPGDSPTRALPLAAVARVEVGERLSQRAACKRGLVRGGMVGALLGAGFLALRRDEPGAAGLTLGGAWLGCVLTGQGTDSPRPPLRWRVVYPGPAR